MADAQGAPVGGSTPSPALTNDGNTGDGTDALGGEAAAVEDVAALFRKHKHRVKVDGKEAEVDYDDLVRDAQKSRAADKRMREAAEEVKRAKALYAELDEFKKDPWSAARKAGQDPYELAERLLLQKLEWEAMSPEAQEAARLKVENATLKERQEAEEKRASEARTKAAEAQALQEIDDEVGEAIRAFGKKPTPRLIARVTESLIAHHERQLEGLQAEYGEQVPDEAYARVQKLPASEALKRVHREYLGDVAEYLGGMSAAELREVLPRSVLDALRQADVNAVLSQDPVGSRKAPAESVRQPKPKKLGTDEWFNKIEAKLNKRA